MYGDYLMYRYTFPGTYSFKNEITLFLHYIREQIDALLKKIEPTA